ncbi:hypothetical protein, partial [Thioalkalivibrio sp. ALgr3]|uniref:hypothetical protein n=1 Tax=Thioalkalivibrio sp. ALgr3 TaxID=1239292 RepID=UPI00056FC868
MKRTDEKKEALVYAYGCGEVPLWSPAIREEVRKQRAFWDALVDMDRELDRELDDRMKADDPAYAAAVEYLKKKAEELREARTARDEARAASRSRKVDPALDKALREAASARDSARREVWRLAAAWRKANKEAIREHQARRKEEIKRLRSASGLFWANYNRVVDDYEAGRKTAMKKGRRMRHFNPDREDGVLTVQIQRTASGLGASPEEVHRGDCSMIHVEAPPVGVEFLGASARRREGRVMARIRVDADGNQVKFPVVMHRPMPTNARVKAVQLVWKREGETVKAKLCFTVSKAKEDTQREATSAAGG